MVGEEGRQRRHRAPRQEEVGEHRKIGDRQDQGDVPHPHPRHQPVEHEQADDQVEDAGAGVELAEQRRQLGLVAARLQHGRVLELRQVGHQQGDEQGQHQGHGVGRGAKGPRHLAQLAQDIAGLAVQVGVAVGDPRPASPQQQRHGRRGQRDRGPDQQEGVHRQDGGQEADDQRPDRGPQRAERREQREQPLGVLDVEIGVGEVPEQRVERDVPHGEVQLQDVVEPGLEGLRQVQLDQRPQDRAAANQGRQRHVNHMVDGEAHQQVGEDRGVDQHHRGREQEDHRQLVRPHMGQERRVASREADAHAGLQQQAEQAELQELRPLAALDPEQAIQQDQHALPRAATPLASR